jgi:hypothetical protein
VPLFCHAINCIKLYQDGIIWMGWDGMGWEILLHLISMLTYIMGAV